MSRQRIIQALKPRYDLAAVKYPFLYFPLHGDTYGDDTATAIKERGYSVNNGQSSPILSSSTLALSGGTTGIWANPGRLTPDATSGTYASIAGNTNLADFHRMSTLESGGLLVAFRVQRAADPAAIEYIYGHSSGQISGGFEIRMEANGKITVFINEQGNTTRTQVLADTTPPSTDIELAYLIYFDCKNKTTAMYRNGDVQTSVADIPTPLPTLDANNWWAFGARSTNGTTNPIGSQGSGMQISEMFVARVEEDISGDIASLAKDYSANYGEIPLGLLSL